jgi:thioesterase domain-containing protein
LGLSWEDLRVSPDELLQLNPAQQLAHVLELATAGNVLPPDIEPSQIERLYAVFKTNFRAMLNYTPQSLRGQITLFKAEEAMTMQGDSRSGWEDYALEGMELLHVPGDHFTMVREPNVKVLAAHLARCVVKATRGESGGSR